MNETEAMVIVGRELRTTQRIHPAYSSPHHGYGVILEELDELWDEIKKQTDDRKKDTMRFEAAQVAATAIRFMIDLT